MDESREVKALAYCIQYALILSGKDKWNHKNEIYWYTRENALELSRKLNIKWHEVVSLHSKIRWESRLDILKKESSLFWDQLASPELVIRNILES